MDYLLRKIIEASTKSLNITIGFRKHLHQNPELSFEETGTAKFITSILAENNIHYFDNFSKTSIIAVVEGDNSGDTIGFRAELDALPIDEKSGYEFSSLNQGVMHACGHDIHMATILNGAIILNDLKNHFKGKAVFIFQSGEEQLPGGAKSIIESETFNKNKPDKMVGIHILPELEAGKAGFREGRYMASGDEIYITVKGKGGHAALPQSIVDPIVIASNLIISLQQVVSRKAPPLIPSVLSFGKINADGATNVIPDKVEIAGTFRTMDEEWRIKAHEIIEQISHNTAKSMGGNCEVEIRKGYPTIFNNIELTKHAAELTRQFLGDKNIVTLDPRMTTDDFSYFSQTIPSVFFRLGAGFEKEENYQLHSSKFLANEELLKFSPGLVAWLAIKLND